MVQGDDVPAQLLRVLDPGALLEAGEPAAGVLERDRPADRVPEAGRVAEAGLVADEDPVHLVLHPRRVEVDGVDVDAGRCVEPLVAWTPEAHVHVDPGRAAGGLDDRLARRERDVAVRVDIDVDVGGDVGVDLRAAARPTKRDGLHVGERGEEACDSPGEREMGRLHGLGSLSAMRARERGTTSAPGAPRPGGSPAGARSRRRPGRAGSAGSSEDQRRVQLDLGQPSADEGELGDQPLLGSGIVPEVEDEVAQRVDDQVAIDELERAGPVRVAAQDCVGAGGDQRAGELPDDRPSPRPCTPCPNAGTTMTMSAPARRAARMSARIAASPSGAAPAVVRVALRAASTPL